MDSPSISFEFFPPRTEAQLRRFWCTLGCLQTLEPSYISMTWGAMGSASQASLDILEPLLKDSQVPVTAHLTCSGETRTSMLQKIERLESLGVTRFLALRGDQPEPVESATEQAEPLLAHASDLVELLCEKAGRDVSVSAYPENHPESASDGTEITWLKHKFDVGGQRAITQFFFEAESFLRFRDRAEAAGIHQPLVPGILPIHDIEKVRGFSEKCGASISAAVAKEFEGATRAVDKHRAAVEHSLKLCNALRCEGVGEFHVYTLNQSALAYDISAELLGVGARKKEPESVGAAA